MTDKEAQDALRQIYEIAMKAQEDQGMHPTRNLILGAIAGMASCGMIDEPKMPGLLRDTVEGH